MRRKGIPMKAFACLLAAAMAMSPVTGVSAKAADATAVSNQIENDVFWHDTDGNPIYSQGGGIFKFTVDGVTKYYWYGVKYEESEAYYNDSGKAQKNNHFAGVTCYSSTDLTNWKYEGDVVVPEEITKREEMDNQDVEWVGRLGVAYMEDTQTYALFVQHECADPDNKLDVGQKDNYSKQVLVLTSDSPTGQFKWNQRIDMRSYTGGTTNTGDQTVFTDEDTGKDYLVYSYGSGRSKIFLSEIQTQADGKVGLGPSYMIYKGAGREGNCMFKYNGKYYICASDLYGWNASHAYYMVLDSLDESYLAEKAKNPETNMKVMPGCSEDFCHVTQTGFFYTVKGSEQETVLFCGDRWADFARNGLGYNQWCPLSFDEDGTPYYNSLSAWNLDEKTGTWTVADNNNYVKNGSFDADRVSSTTLAGWKNQVTKGNSPIQNNGTTTTGKYALRLGDSTDFSCAVSQTIQSNQYVSLPDGTYDMSAKIKNGGSFQNLQMYAKSGDMTMNSDIAQNQSEWTTVTMKHVVVSGGKVTIGFSAEGAADAWCNIDDVTFVKSADAVETGKISGTITSDLTGENLILRAQSESGDTYTKTVLLDGEKTEYSFDFLKPGTYTISAQLDGTEIEEPGSSVEVASGQSVSGIDLTVKNMSGNIAGTVTDGNAALSGVTVSLKQNDAVVAQTETDENGQYSFRMIPTGAYTLTFEKTTYETVSDVEIQVVKGEQTSVPNQELKSMSGNLKGFVFQADGTPVSNASVLLRKTDNRAESVTYTAQTDENGKIALKQLVPGTYQAIVTSGDLTAIKSDIVITENKETALPVLMAKEQIAVPNGDFEASWSNKRNIPSWSTESTGAYLENKTPYAGKTRISFWSSSPFFGHIYQTISGLENGTYYVTAMVKGVSADGDESYIYAKDSEGNFIGKQEIPISENDWIKVGVPVQVTDGTMTIGVYQKLSGSMWLNLDNVEAYYAGPVDTAIEVVESKIEAIGADVTLESEGAIEEARTAYDALNEAQKMQISNYETLEKAEEKLAELKADAAAVKDVESKIEAIGTEITLESEGVIEEARAAYDALTEAQKEQVSNYDALEKAEEKLAELKKAPVYTDGLSDSCDADGNWYYYRDNAVDTEYTGLAANQNGWFMVVNGKVDFGYTGLAANENGWFVVVNGKVDFGYTGLAANENGWFMVVNGKVDFGYTGLAANENGWFMVVNGKVDFGYTGLAANENGWFMVVNGKIDFAYNGVVFNEFGGWYVQSGKINFAYTGMIQYQGVWCQVLNGKVMF